MEFAINRVLHRHWQHLHRQVRGLRAFANPPVIALARLTPDTGRRHVHGQFAKYGETVDIDLAERHSAPEHWYLTPPGGVRFVQIIAFFSSTEASSER